MRTNVIDLYKLNQAKARLANAEIIAMFGGPDIERDEDPEHFDMRKEANIVLRTLEVAMTDDELECRPETFRATTLQEDHMLVHLGQRSDELTREQAGRIATSNLMDVAPSQEDQYFEMPSGTQVSLGDLWQGTKGFRSYLDQLEALAAKCGGIIEHPGDTMYPNAADNVTPNSFFVVPTTTSHGGARPGAGRPALYDGSTIRFSLTLSVEQSNWLDAQGQSRADAIRQLIDEAISRETRHANMS